MNQITILALLGAINASQLTPLTQKQLAQTEFARNADGALVNEDIAHDIMSIAAVLGMENNNSWEQSPNKPHDLWEYMNSIEQSVATVGNSC